MARKPKTRAEKAAIKEEQLLGLRAQIHKMTLAEKNKVEVPLVNRLKGYEQFFVRNPDEFVLKTKSSDRFKQTLELVRHVFHKYPVPPFMSYIWNKKLVVDDKQLNSEVNYRLQGRIAHENWYICLATGGSLYKEYFKEHFTKKETHCFVTCKHNLRIEEALVYAIAKADGATDGNALRVARTKLNQKEVRSEFWKHAIRFFAKAEEKLTINQINDLIDYLEHRRNERPAGPPIIDRVVNPDGSVTLTPRPHSKFELAGSGFTITSLTKRMLDWHYEMRRIKVIGNASWEGRDALDSEFNLTVSTDKQGRKLRTRWKFIQIKTSKELQQEGNVQHHCVFSYRDRCIRGDISIWSLRQIADEYGMPMDKRRVTIELSKDGTIMQARGFANRSPLAPEWKIINEWVKQEGFKLNSYL